MSSARPLLPAAWFPRWIKPVVHLLSLGWLASIAVRAVAGQLGANPVEAATRLLGDQALVFLLLCLALTPLRRLTGWTAALRLRRLLGLYAFAAAALHLAAYVGLDQFFAWDIIWRDILRRRFITVGMVAMLLLLALAVTSWPPLIRRLGGVRWRKLHRLVYPAAALVILHYFWMVKADTRTPLIYGGVLLALLALRLPSGWLPAALRR